MFDSTSPHCSKHVTYSQSLLADIFSCAVMLWHTKLPSCPNVIIISLMHSLVLL